MKYIEAIKSEKVKANYQKSDLLKDEYLLSAEGNIKIYYAPIDFINTNASVVIVGITPGWTQMEISFQQVIKSLHDGKSWEESLKEVKNKASFAGSMRNNLIKMLDEVHLNEKLNIASCSLLFNSTNSYLHSTSILKYPVFNKGENYTGKNPSPIKNKILWNSIINNFVPEINSFKSKLIIPLGVSVSEVLKELSNQNHIKNNIILEHFPHPSGANGTRKKQFESHKDKLSSQIANWSI